MGKGDTRSKRGKIHRKTFGKSRPGHKKRKHLNETPHKDPEPSKKTAKKRK